VCREFGVSPTTLRLLEAEGVLPKARRVEFLKRRRVRVFSDDDVRRARSALAKWCV
jgi:DNA-binding transcriptional MerR regulator